MLILELSIEKRNKPGEFLISQDFCKQIGSNLERVNIILTNFPKLKSTKIAVREFYKTHKRTLTAFPPAFPF